MPVAKVVNEFKEFERMFRKVIRPKSYEARKEAKGTLTPQIFKKLESGRLKPEDIAKLLKGKKDDGTLFTLQDLQRFNELKIKKSKTFNASVAGAPVPQLLSETWTKDLERAREGIKTATLYRVNGDLLHFRTPSETNPGTYHQVRVKLEEWKENLTGGKDCISSVKRAAMGRVSFDCDCERHQFYFRYLATVGGYALEPFEYAFPKIRNPGLGGALCKHAIRVMTNLKSPFTHQILAREMQKQAEAVGFGGDKSKTRFLTKAELDELEKIGAAAVPTHDALVEEWAEFQKAIPKFQEKLIDRETQKVLTELRKEMEGKAMEQVKRIAAETVAKAEIKLRKQETERANRAETEKVKAIQKTNDLAAQNAAQAAMIAELERKLAEKG